MLLNIIINSVPRAQRPGCGLRRRAFAQRGEVLQSLRLGGPLAQTEEHRTFNPRVGGSTPPRPTTAVSPSAKPRPDSIVAKQRAGGVRRNEPASAPLLRLLRNNVPTAGSPSEPARGMPTIASYALSRWMEAIQLARLGVPGPRGLRTRESGVKAKYSRKARSRLLFIDGCRTAGR